MKHSAWIVLLWCVCLAFLTGCGQKTAGELSSAEKRAFDQAPAELKAQWTAALEAGGTNDYVSAQTLLYGLLNQTLSQEQKQAVGKALSSLNDRLYSALDKGDPEAQKAIEELRRNPPNRPPR
jgi:tRNA A37 N6-isopentenylltransferase MiaA